MMWLLAQAVQTTNDATAGGAAGSPSGSDFAEIMRAMPAVWTVVLAIGLVLGLILWAFGGRLAMKGVMLSGFVLGGLTAMGAATATTSEGQGVWVLLVGMVGAITGVLLAWLLFRLWMGLTAGLLLAAVVPLTAMVWQGNGPQLSMVINSQSAAMQALGKTEGDTSGYTEKAAEVWRQIESGASKPQAAGDPSRDDVAGDESTYAEFDRQQFLDAMAQVGRQQIEEIKAWWSALEPGPRRVLISGSAIGGVIGLLLGLILPFTAAALQSALAGSVLIFFAGRGLVLAYLPESVNALPGTWRGVLLSVGLITLLGLLVQWTVRKRKSDD